MNIGKFKFKTREKAASGKVLISEPFLDDPNFERTVVLICDHNEEGSFGFVLNKPMDSLMLKDVVDGVENDEFPIYIGGPVEQDVLQFIHTIDTLPGAIDLGNGIYLGGDYEMLKLLVNNEQVKEGDIRFFVGYSGWSEGQLQDELNNEVWIVTSIDKQNIFNSDTDGLWRSILKNMGGKYKVISNFPVDPRLN